VGVGGQHLLELELRQLVVPADDDEVEVLREAAGAAEDELAQGGPALEGETVAQRGAVDAVEQDRQDDLLHRNPYVDARLAGEAEDVGQSDHRTPTSGCSSRSGTS